MITIQGKRTFPAPLGNELRHLAVIGASAKSELRSLAPSELTRPKISVTSS